MLEAETKRCKSEQVMPGDGGFRELNTEINLAYIYFCSHVPVQFEYRHEEDPTTSCACPRQAVNGITLKMGIFLNHGLMFIYRDGSGM